MQFDLGPEDRYMVLCTDGIFEFLTNEDILDYVDQKANLGWQTSDIAQGLVSSLCCRAQSCAEITHNLLQQLP